jgi:flagellar motor switch protein FliN
MSDEPSSSLTEENKQNIASGSPDLERLLDVNMSLSIEIGRAQIKLQDLLHLTKGAVIELNKLSGEPLDIYANGKLIAHGDVISVNGKYGIRLTSVHNQNSHTSTDNT